ncbi:MAG: hypothetical protein JW825_03810 [Candidatus Methanofastidiosa archaeon]|nr:hypothetical protein [Candidatus Methanofastidiosa archaeon]
MNRGKKSVREILEMGFKEAHNRIIIVETKDGNPYILSSLDPKKGLEWSKRLYITIKTRKDLGIRTKVQPLREDIPVGMICNADDETASYIADMFEADKGIESEVAVQVIAKGDALFIDFIRSDISSRPIGPQIRVRKDDNDNRDNRPVGQ